MVRHIAHILADMVAFFQGNIRFLPTSTFHLKTIVSSVNYFSTLPSKQLESSASHKCFKFLQENICIFIFPKRRRFGPWVEKSPWRRAGQPTPVFLPGELTWTEEPGGLQSMGPQRVRHD